MTSDVGGYYGDEDLDEIEEAQREPVVEPLKSVKPRARAGAMIPLERGEDLSTATKRVIGEPTLDDLIEKTLNEMTGVEIVGWDDVCETSETRKLKKLKSIPMAPGVNSPKLVNLVVRYKARGLLALGVFNMLLRFHGDNEDIEMRRSGKLSCEEQGVVPLDTLAGLLRVDVGVLTDCVELLCSPDVALLRQISVDH